MKWKKLFATHIGEITDMYCSCPYALDGRNCKHMAAVLYEWSEEAEEEESANVVREDLFQPAYTINAYKKKVFAVEELVSGAKSLSNFDVEWSAQR